MGERGESDSRDSDARAAIAAERARVQRRTLTVVVISQVLGGAGLAAGVTVGALLVQDVLGLSLIHI